MWDNFNVDLSIYLIHAYPKLKQIVLHILTGAKQTLCFFWVFWLSFRRPSNDIHFFAFHNQNNIHKHSKWLLYVAFMLRMRNETTCTQLEQIPHKKY